jgi:hypothetical protein
MGYQCYISSLAAICIDIALQCEDCLARKSFVLCNIVTSISHIASLRMACTASITGNVIVLRIHNVLVLANMDLDHCSFKATSLSQVPDI